MIFHNNIAIVEKDSHLSRWVVEHNTLEVQKEYWHLFKKYIPEDGTVIDIGACIGDSTATFADMVPKGLIWAFEPNPPALECLRHNMQEYGNVVCFGTALGDFEGTASIHHEDWMGTNLGAVQLRPDGEIKVGTLDYLVLNLMNYGVGSPEKIDFIKIDAEGWEPRILHGGYATIERHRPVMVIEVNRPVLAEQGFSDKDILEPLKELGYSVQPSEPHISMDSPMLDILCLP